MSFEVPEGRWSTPRAGGVHESQSSFCDCLHSDRRHHSVADFRIILPDKKISSYIASRYHEHSHDVNGIRCVCNGSPTQVIAQTHTGYQKPEARTANNTNQYLRYSNNIVTVGLFSNYMCKHPRRTAQRRIQSRGVHIPRPRVNPRITIGVVPDGGLAPKTSAEPIRRHTAMNFTVQTDTVNLNPILRGVVASFLYFLVVVAILATNFVTVDALIPGQLQQMALINRRPNAVVTISTIASGVSQLSQGLVGVAIYGFMGVVILRDISG
uniref:B1177_F3_123 n=2 Tax=Mycobacterium leprae TaxID=1769 RepID=Q79DI6_MYCLR|nr:B1177_F3_123 protein - Mycobacterium leprae [Mycobacterium leprae]AAA17110.1 B1177_F3_123 [Mycobacterium leprae]